MILTYKVKHDENYSHELMLARKVAEIALKTKTQSSRDVKHIGLKSIISNQILRKYSRNRKLKRIKNVLLTIPSQGIKVDKELREIYIPCLKKKVTYMFPNDFKKINQIEINDTYMFINVTVTETKPLKVDNYIGVDRNITKHIVVAANPRNGKVLKLGKKAQHIRSKYKNIRRNKQKDGNYKSLKNMNRREHDIINNLNHRISRKIVDWAYESNSGIKLENLKGIRKTRTRKSFKYSLNSWSFYQLEKMIEYKAKLLGVPVLYIAPEYTSKRCSRCGHIGERKAKIFKCHICGHVDHADVNAAFNIAKTESFDQLNTERDVFKGSTDTPNEAMT